MIKRISIISTAALAALLVAGLAWATPDDSPSSSSSTTSTTVVQSAAAGSQTAIGSETYDAGAAGQVTVDRTGASLSVGHVAANSGWVSEVEAANGREVEVKFVNGTERIDFQAELEDGLVKTRVRVRALDGSTGDSSSNDSSSDDSLTLTAPGTGALAFKAGDAGSVQLRAANGALELVGATPNAGWTVTDIEIEGSREINVEFHNGTTEVEFIAEMEDGLVKTRVRTEMDDDSNDDSSDDADDQVPGDDRSDDSDDSDDGNDDDSSGRSDDDDIDDDSDGLDD
jgi:hypothetical protein